MATKKKSPKKKVLGSARKAGDLIDVYVRIRKVNAEGGEDGIAHASSDPQEMINFITKNIK